jgi:hypothetical protein
MKTIPVKSIIIFILDYSIHAMPLNIPIDRFYSPHFLPFSADYIYQ